MKLFARVSVGITLLVGCCSANANITNALFHVDPSQILDSWAYSYPSKAGDAAEAMLSGNQYQAATISGDVLANSTADPTLLRGNDVFNDTDFVWGGYKVVITMPQTFSISAPTVATPGDWSGIAIQPTLSGGSYVGEVDFSSGTHIAIGDELDFSYKVSFSGSAHYSIDEDFTPLPVPEPGLAAFATLAALSGGLAFLRRSKKNG